MTITAYSSAIVDVMLGWLKGLANWVLRLFNLAGSSGTSPLLWLSQNWLRLLIVLMIVGVAGDLLVWLVRWRPHWVWFRKERVIVDDERFFNESAIRDKLDPDGDDLLEKNWEERDYVVASTLVKRHEGAKAKADPKRRVPTRRDARTRTSFQRGERRGPGVSSEPDPRTRRQRDAEEVPAPAQKDLFGLDGNRPGVTDFYEDEVFNVNNLPKVDDYPFEEKAEETEV